jgi:hypothetical protein
LLRKYLKLLLLLIFGLADLLLAQAHPPTLPAPGNWSIISDYGPRNVSNGSWFHPGIDYSGPSREKGDGAKITI